MRSDLTDLWWATGGGLIAGSIAVASDPGPKRVVFALACVVLLAGAVVAGFRVLRQHRGKRA